MTVITHNRRRSRLSTLIDQPGGISTVTALRHAAEMLVPLEQRSAAAIEQALRDLSSISPPQTLEDNESAVNKAYRLSSSIIDAVGPFSRDDLCAVARNLCDLLDAAPSEKIFDWRIVTVHAQAARLLIALPPEESQAREQVLGSLKSVLRVKVGEDAA